MVNRGLRLEMPKAPHLSKTAGAKAILLLRLNNLQ